MRSRLTRKRPGVVIDGDVERPLVLVAEDDDEIRDALFALFCDDGFRVRAVADGTELLRAVATCIDDGDGPAVVVTDHRIPGASGLAVLQAIRSAGWDVPVVMITAFGREIADAARASGASAILQKPFDVDDLRTLVFVHTHRPPAPLSMAQTSSAHSTIPVGFASRALEAWRRRRDQRH